MFGPSMALKGADQSSVKVASEYMRDEQSRIFFVGAISITALFAGSCFLSWTIYPTAIASITTVVYVLSYVFLILEGKRAYAIFVPAEDVTLSTQNGLPGQSGNTVQVTTAEMNASNEKKVLLKVYYICYFYFIFSET